MEVSPETLTAKRSVYARKTKKRIFFTIDEKDGILSEFSSTPGKWQGYHTMMDWLSYLYSCERITMFGLPGTGSWFETQVAKLCSENKIPLTMYLIEREKAKYEQVRHNMGELTKRYPDCSVYAAHTRLTGNELSSAKFIGMDGTTIKKDFDDLCEWTNFVWLDFMGPLNDDYISTVKTILTTCQTANLLFGLTIGSRCKSKRDLLMDSEFVVDRARNKWVVGDHLETFYQSKGDVPMVFQIMFLRNKDLKKRKAGVK
jgi:hypothetical protein